MSAEAPKPVDTPVEAPKAAEETPVAPTEAPVEAPAAAEAAPVEAEAPAEEATEAALAKEEVKPVEEGVLGYKGPGLLKSFIFQKKFFYFGTEPVESKALASYLRGEKAQDTANKNVAWASNTGKGLLFFTKKASEKATPAGIINLSDVSDVTEEGTIDFVFTLGGHKHTFQASTLSDRDNWVSVLKTKVAEAKELAPAVVESEEYKKTLADLTKPAVVAAAVPKKSVEKPETPKEEKKEEKAEKKEEKADEKKEEKKTRKSRSASRKRNSIFGNFGLGKKEEKTETPAPATTEETPAVAPAADEPVVAAAEPAAVSEATEATPAAEEASAPAEKPAPVKRNSIFGTLKSQFSQHKTAKSETETAPAAPAKDAEPVSENAPVIPAVEASEPLATSVASPATAPTEAADAPATNGETKATDAPAVKSDKRKSSLPWLSKKEKATTTSDEETEKPKSPFAKLRATVKGKASPKAEKASDKPATAEETTEATPAPVEPVVSEPEKVVPQTTPQVTASA